MPVVKRSVPKTKCCSCGKAGLNRNEVSLCHKLLGEGIKEFYCLDCLAAYLEVSREDLSEKIEEFKEQGCILFD
ncbi:hypothetical protein IJT93_01085 [bacterium]|nr:hypothetical protein [bacterium]